MPSLRLFHLDDGAQQAFLAVAHEDSVEGPGDLARGRAAGENMRHDQHALAAAELAHRLAEIILGALALGLMERVGPQDRRLAGLESFPGPERQDREG